MATKFAQLVPTRESISESGALGATQDALKAAETTVDVAEGNVEMSKDAAELDNLDAAIVDAFDGIKAIEELKDLAEETMKEGGMTPRVAKALEISHESIMSSLGMSHRKTTESKNPIVTMESFKSAQTRISGTIQTMENLQESINTVKQKVMAGLKQAIAMVMQFFGSLTKNRQAMEQHLNNLAGQVTAIGADAQKKAEQISGGAATISVNGQANAGTARTLLASAKSLLEGAMMLTVEIGKINPAQGDPAVMTNALSEKTQGLVSSLGNNNAFTKGRKLAAEGGLLGLVEGGGTAEQATAPSREEMTGLLNEAKGVLQVLRSYEAGIKNLQRGAEASLASMMANETAAQQVEGSNDEGASKAREHLARAVGRQVTRLGSQVPSWAFDAVKGSADFVRAGIANFAAAPAAAPAAGAAPAAAA